MERIHRPDLRREEVLTMLQQIDLEAAIAIALLVVPDFAEYLEKYKTPAEAAFWWARKVGNQNLMKDIIIAAKAPKWAYMWSRWFGDQDG